MPPKRMNTNETDEELALAKRQRNAACMARQRALRTSEEAEADRQRHASTVANIRAARTSEHIEIERQQNCQS